LLARVEHARRRGRRPGALEAEAVHVVAMPARDEPFLELKLSRGGLDPGAQPIVGGGQERRPYPERLRDPPGDEGERLACAQRLRAHEMEAEIEVAEPEPRLAVQRGDALEHCPG